MTIRHGAHGALPGDHKPLFPKLDKKKFTFQMSDHLPLWIQVNTDIEGIKLDQIIQG